MTEIRKDMITALVDGEVTDEIQRQVILSQIESDKDFAIEYKVQSLIKNLVKDKVVFQKTPDKVRTKILNSISSDTRVVSEKKSFLPNLFEKPSFSFATAFVVVLAVALIILNRPGLVEKMDLAIEQIGDNNMFVQAKNNFKGFLDGRMVPKFTSADPERIQAYFKNNGVQYSTLVPILANWNILGAVVSEDKGEKFAHLIYVGKKGELTYLFQVDESYLQSREIIFLTDDLIKYLDEGNCYSSISNSSVTIFTKIDNNICAIISNGNPKELENIFCSYK
ncbi:MAG: hypothetical protein Q8M94_06100 [Ignavibacteria bacterium]|nr:hypothetical protein [Ignavibacteria bacterium]